MKKSLKLGLLLLMSLVLAACSQTGSSSDNHEVSIMLDWYPNAVHSYLYVAEEKGYFEEEGVNVSIQFPTNPTDPLNLVAADRITLGLYYQPDVIMARANENVPVKAIASIVRSPLNHIVLLEDSPIQSPKDLEGLKLGYPGIPLNEALMHTMISHDGGDPDAVDMIDVGFELGSSMVTNNVDAVIGAYINHEVPVLRHEGYETRYFNPTDFGVPAYNEIVLVTSENTWEEEREGIEAFWRAARKGFEFMQQNPDEALSILLSNQDQTNFPLIEEVEKESMSILLPKMTGEGEAFGSQQISSWEEVRDWMYEAGLITTSPEAEEFFININ
ncbi:ABC transporter substrate-binding protein [Bacillus horti]|uniref:Hydroxymethylpyrimidine transport system substrate-binding protein n=1 Tax=Caldalkalibacillus horti TaxID=77523 RepID=A0ABT9VYC8_9BACI|nr:ABC transporter substrate-binding protein [Bacillus horti]MDQ0166003.1 putative hydroxymethylpyrimidine transport system substrate-binding protein [Bacillus horti]